VKPLVLYSVCIAARQEIGENERSNIGPARFWVWPPTNTLRISINLECSATKTPHPLFENWIQPFRQAVLNFPNVIGKHSTSDLRWVVLECCSALPIDGIDSAFSRQPCRFCHRERDEAISCFAYSRLLCRSATRHAKSAPCVRLLSMPPSRSRLA
jgi:hypothetical protein